MIRYQSARGGEIREVVDVLDLGDIRLCWDLESGGDRGTARYLGEHWLVCIRRECHLDTVCIWWVVLVGSPSGDGAGGASRPSVLVCDFFWAESDEGVTEGGCWDVDWGEHIELVALGGDDTAGVVGSIGSNGWLGKDLEEAVLVDEGDRSNGCSVEGAEESSLSVEIAVDGFDTFSLLFRLDSSYAVLGDPAVSETGGESGLVGRELQGEKVGWVADLVTGIVRWIGQTSWFVRRSEFLNLSVFV